MTWLITEGEFVIPAPKQNLHHHKIKHEREVGKVATQLLMTQHELLSKGNTRYDVSSVAEQDKY
jgi:hypothetical protein